MREEYPLVFQNSNIHNLSIIKKGDEILCHAAVKPLLVKTPWGLIKIAGIGSVVTKEDYRRQGLSAQTMKACLQTASLLGCEVAILWTDLYDFYRKLGFELAGSEVHLKITEKFQPPQWSGLKIIKGDRVDPQALMKIGSQHRVTTLRKVPEISSHLGIPNSKVYTCWNDKGLLMAYAVEGKGADLDGYIHEWGGGVQALSALAHHIRQEQGRDLVWLSPGHSENLIRRFEEYGAERTHGFLGMMQLLHTDRLFQKIRHYARTLGVPLLIESTDTGTTLGLDGDLLHLEDGKDLVKVLFGPSRPSEFNAWGTQTSMELDKIFPLPFWIWGWDSV